MLGVAADERTGERDHLLAGRSQRAEGIALGTLPTLFLVCLIHQEIIKVAAQLLLDVAGRLVAAQLARHGPERLLASPAAGLALAERFQGQEHVVVVRDRLTAAGTTAVAFAHGLADDAGAAPLGPQFGPVSGDEVPPGLFGALPLDLGQV